MAENNTYRQIECDEDVYTLLKALLDAQGAFVSGAELAAQLKVSRPTIGAKLEKLKATGFDFEAVRNRGYRLTSQPNVLNAAMLRYYMELRKLALDVLLFPVIDSTNNEADRQISYHRKSPFVIASNCQTMGRGRLGREWYSSSADNLYLSVLFEPEPKPHQLQLFTLWAGIYICRALQSYTPKTDLKIKWPNDLHCGGRKFAGMLTEAKMDADGLKTIVFGVGINVNSNPVDFPEPLNRNATSLRALSGIELDFNEVTSAVIEAIQQAYLHCTCFETHQEALTDAWKPLDALQGQVVTAQMGDQETTGIAVGIAENGALKLQNEYGDLIKIHAGDVTLKK